MVPPFLIALQRTKTLSHLRLSLESIVGIPDQLQASFRLKMFKTSHQSVLSSFKQSLRRKFGWVRFFPT